MARARNSQKSDTRLPPVPYTERRGIRPVPPVPEPPPTGVSGGDAPVFDEATLSFTATAETPFTEAVELTAGDLPYIFLCPGLPDTVTLHPTTGVVSGTLPDAALYTFDIVVFSPYGTDTGELEIDQT